MKTFVKLVAVAALAVFALVSFGGSASAQHCAAPVVVQQQLVAQPVVVAQPVYVVPGAPTVAFQQVTVASAAFVAQPVVVQQQKLVQRQVVQRVVQPQVIRQRSFSLQRSVIR